MLTTRVVGLFFLVVWDFFVCGFFFFGLVLCFCLLVWFVFVCLFTSVFAATSNKLPKCDIFPPSDNVYAELKH